MDSKGLAWQIAGELSNDTAVIFLGVGASRGTESERSVGKGVAGSNDLMRAIADRFGVELKESSTLRGVASVAEKNRDPNTVKTFVIDQIRPGCGVPLAAHKALARVAPATVMTTNYDDLYEAALREAGRQYGKIVRSEQLVALPSNRLHVFKLHGDMDRPHEIVLTGRDYRQWYNGAGGLRTKVEATLQEKVCVFVGYSVRDENLREILKIIEGNYGRDARKHFAVVHEVDDELAAELEGVVEFVEGDATAFLEDLAEEVERLRPQVHDPTQQRATFEDQLSSGDLTGAHETCKQLASYLAEHDRHAAAASLWRTLGEAAAAASEHRSAAMAFKEAGQLLFEVGYTLDAEPLFEAALNEAQVAGEPAIEQEMQPLLQRVRLSTGHFDEVLQDTEGALRAYGDDAPPGLIYALYLLRAEANEMLHGTEEASSELRAAIDKLPEGSLLRTKAWAQLARVQAGAYDWDAARRNIDEASAEVQRRAEENDEEGEVCHAVLKLVRANIYQATGEDESALRLYLECTTVLQASGEIGLAGSALQGLVRSQVYVLSESSEADRRADLSDLLRDSSEHRQIADLERQGIAHLAQDNLAAANQNLVQAMAAANRVHSYESHRRIQHWVARVLLKSNHIHEALATFAAAGTSKEAVEAAKAARMSVPASTEGTAPPFDKLLAIASVGDVASRGAALAALAQLWDVLPDDNLPALADYLSGLDSFRSSIFANRSVLSDAADLVFNLAPRLDEGQAQNVGTAVILSPFE